LYEILDKIQILRRVCYVNHGRTCSVTWFKCVQKVLTTSVERNKAADFYD